MWFKFKSNLTLEKYINSTTKALFDKRNDIVMFVSDDRDGTVGVVMTEATVEIDSNESCCDNGVDWS